MCTEMGMAGIPRETRGDGDKVEKSCGNPAEMEVSLAGFPRGWKKIMRESRRVERDQLKPDTVDGLLFLHGLKH